MAFCSVSGALYACWPGTVSCAGFGRLLFKLPSNGTRSVNLTDFFTRYTECWFKIGYRLLSLLVVKH